MRLRVRLAVFLDLAKGRVDVLDDEPLDFRARNDFSDDGDRVRRDDLHTDASPRARLVVLALAPEKGIFGDQSEYDETGKLMEAAAVADQPEADEPAL